MTDKDIEINSRARGRCGNSFKSAITEHMLYIDQAHGHFLWNLSQGNGTEQLFWLISSLVRVVSWLH